VSATDGGGGGVDSVMMSSATVANGGDTADVLNSTSVSSAEAAEHTIYTHLTDPSSSIIWVSRRQKNKTVVDFNDARDDQVLGRQWHRQPGRMQTICKSLQTYNHAHISPLNFYRLDALPNAQPTVSEH